MRLILTFILALSSSLLFAQQTAKNDLSTDSVVLKTFIAELSNDAIAVDVILSQHMIIENPTDEIYDYLEVSLEEIRINLMTKTIEDIQYIPYEKMPKKEIKDIDLEDLDPKHVYFLIYKNRQMLALYLEEGKIASFTLVAKGNGKAHFVLY